MNLLTYIPNKYLPTAATKLVAALFTVLACAAFSIPQVLQNFGVSVIQREDALLKAAGFLLFSLIGVLVGFVLAVNKYTDRKSYFSAR
jgi:hypothetical protein